MDAYIDKAIEDKEKEQQEALKNSEVFMATANLLDGILPNEEESGVEVLATLLYLDDDTFEVLAPTFIEELKKAFNNSQMQLALAQSLNVGEIKFEDLKKEADNIITNLKEKNELNLSSLKIDFLIETIDIVLNTIAEADMITKRVIQVPVQLEDGAIIPTYAHASDAAMDLYSLEEYIIRPGEQILVRTGIKIALPYGYALLIQPRSGLSIKSKLRIPNTPGLIDSGYRGEICVPMENIEPNIKDFVLDEDGKATGILYGNSYTIEKGERIAQARLVEVPTISWAEVSNILEFDSDRGEGGFGSTGTK